MIMIYVEMKSTFPLLLDFQRSKNVSTKRVMSTNSGATKCSGDSISGIELGKALLYGVTSMGDKCERLDKVLEFFG